MEVLPAARRARLLQALGGGGQSISVSTFATQAFTGGLGTVWGGRWDSLTELSGAAMVSVSGVVPEPSTLVLLAFGVSAIAAGRRRRLAA